jgi:hypothetical protein
VAFGPVRTLWDWRRTADLSAINRVPPAAKHGKRGAIELIVHKSANCKTPCCHRRGRTLRALCVINQLMLEFPVRLIQELTVVFSCAHRAVFKVVPPTWTPIRSSRG